jgi:hypothetical protein
MIDCSISFFLFQLCTFLLYGAEGVVAMEVQEWLLRKCSGDGGGGGGGGGGGYIGGGGDGGSAGVHLAHAMYWFLSAHALLERHPSLSTNALGR